MIVVVGKYVANEPIACFIQSIHLSFDTLSLILQK